MVRPALSAARGFEIVDLLAASPERRFTLSEIARAAGINVASCHAVLGVMVERGYLAREPATRSYSLGQMLYAAGQAALLRQPLLDRARNAGEAIVAEVDIPVVISGVIGDDIVGLVSIPDSHGGTTGLRVAERRPLIPPIGTPFIAWAGEEAVAAWLAKASDSDTGSKEELRRAIGTIRSRGFEVLLRSGEHTLASALNAFAADPVLARGQVHRLGPDMSLPESIEPDGRYEVLMIAAPIFDRHGACAYNLCLGPFAGLLTGAQVLAHADRLLRACVATMQADRAPP
jgi:DNA-binding IclR family transcriptional regulator